MDTARAAEMNHRECNSSFSRQWTRSPTRRKGLRRHNVGQIEKVNNEMQDNPQDDGPSKTLQAVARRILLSERRAGLLDTLGLSGLALRQLAVATDIRAVLA